MKKMNQLVLKTIKSCLVIYKASLPVGTKSQRKDGTYQKQPDGKWKKIVEEKKQKDDNRTDEQKKEENKNIRKKYGMPKAKDSALKSLMEKGENGEDLYSEYGIEAEQELIGAAWLAGEKGTPIPFINVGWRYGKAEGASHNFQEDKDEAGVSTAKMKGFKEIKSFAATPQGRKKYYYIGYVITHDTGGDDELLFVPEGTFAPKEISEEDYNNYSPEIPDLGDWWYKDRLEKE